MLTEQYEQTKGDSAFTARWGRAVGSHGVPACGPCSNSRWTNMLGGKKDWGGCPTCSFDGGGGGEAISERIVYPRH